MDNVNSPCGHKIGERERERYLHIVDAIAAK